MGEKLIKKYGLFWEREKMFYFANGQVRWTEVGWPSSGSPLEGARGIYILYKAEKPIYVGIALEGDNPISKRIHDHAKDWLAPWWNSVCWYDFGENENAARVVEALMVSHGPGLWNGTEPGGNLFGDPCFLENKNNYATVELWKFAANKPAPTE